MTDTDGNMVALDAGGSGGSWNGNYAASTKQKYQPKNEPMDPNSPPPPSTEYKPPKNPDKAKNKVPAPGGRGDTGWLDKSGRAWVPDPKMDGGAGWRRHYPDGSHDHVYPDGQVRSHNFDFQPPSQETITNIANGVATVGLIALGVYAFVTTGNPAYLEQALQK